MTTRLNDSAISTTGNIIGNVVQTNNYQYANGAPFTTPTSYNNANVATFMADFGSNTVSTTGNITSGYLFGNGSQLTGIVANTTYGDSNVTTFMADFGSNTISTTGNITSGYLFGNGSQLTGIVANTTYGDSNVATYLPTYTGNLQSVTGNIATTGTANLTFGPSGAGNVVVAGNMYVQGGSVRTTATVGTLFGINATTVNIGNAATTVNIGATNGVINAAGNISAVGNITGSNILGNLTLPAGGFIQTGVGTDGNIFIHPDGNGIVTVQGNTTGALLYVAGDEPNSQNRVEVDTFGNVGTLGGTFSGRFARGSATSPQTPDNGDQLATFRGKGWANGSYTNATAQITMTAVGDWSPTNTSTNISFYTTPANTTTMQRVANLSADGSYVQLIGNITVANGFVRTNAFAVSSLPAAGNAGVGSRSFVTDADTRSFGNVAVGGGGNSMPVWTDGSVWYIG